MKKEITGWTALGWIAGALLLLPLVALLHGWVLTILWGWFVVSTLHVPSLTLFPAIGISLVLGFLIYVPTPERPDDTVRQAFTRAFGLLIGRPLTYLAVGWLVHEIMVRYVVS